MLKNADCTLYLYNKATQGFTRHIINGVYWRENKAGNVLRSGLQTADSTTIYLYSDDVKPLTVAKDMLVRGVCDFDFDNTNQQTISESMKNFKNTYNAVTVMSIDDYMFGSLPHIEISAK
ncbi:MAG: DUF6751 family protein [Pseudoruminococcus massiliensis]|uniref:DUF6751 family protein n=1 Tax=Pseudoruminococcus massiliensis TaxID=2086583 RepID=UPI0039940CAC